MEQIPKNVVPDWMDLGGSTVPAFKRKQEWEGSPSKGYKEPSTMPHAEFVSINDNQKKDELLKLLERSPVIQPGYVKPSEKNISKKEVDIRVPRFIKFFRNFMNFNHRLNSFFERTVINFFKKIPKSR